jgi:hypothetical protein
MYKLEISAQQLGYQNIVKSENTQQRNIMLSEDQKPR